MLRDSLALLLLMPSIVMAQDPGSDTPRDRFETPALVERMAEAGQRWLPFLVRPSLTCGLYTLPAGATDGQSPPERDEVYYVVRGAAELEVAGERHPVGPGSIRFVAAGVEHRFVDVTADLVALVLFSEVRGTRGGMAAGPVPTGQTPYDEHSSRGQARIFYWYGDGSAGQCVIDHGRPAWRDAYRGFLDGEGPRRWRFGENFWSTLDTNIPLTIGGAELDVGLYYLVLEVTAGGDVRLVALDPDVVRERRLDAYEANETRGGIAIPLTRRTAGASPAPRLDVALEVLRGVEADGGGDAAELRIAFGPLRFVAPVVLRP